MVQSNKFVGFCARLAQTLVLFTNVFLPTNFTNLHETCSIILMATCSVARIFTNQSIVLEIFGCTRLAQTLN